MTEQRIDPEKVTKPIQLLAAWLVGLIITNGSFLVAAAQFAAGSWERGILVISAIVNVPLFLFSLFMLQTRFRPELQEDSYYADYLSKKTAIPIRVDKNSEQDAKIEGLEEALARLSHEVAVHELNSLAAPPLTIAIDGAPEPLDWSNWAVALNQTHPRAGDIREALRRAQIPLADIFGDNPPTRWIVSISYHLPVAHKALLLRTILPLGFDGFQLWEPQREADENEDVYIGGYGEQTVYAKITDELGELLDKKVEAVDINFYYSRHKVRRRIRKPSVAPV